MPRSKAPRAGFSLVEALVVLAISSLLLVLIFGVTTGARDAGFRMARRADAGAAATVGTESLRALLRGVRLPQRGRWPGGFSGGPDALTAYIAPARPTPCPASPGTPTRLVIETTAGRSRLACQTGDGRAASLLDLGPGAARFSYALAGRPWTDRITAELAPERTDAEPGPPPTLWIRLAGQGGREILEAADAPPGTSGGRS